MTCGAEVLVVRREDVETLLARYLGMLSWSEKTFFEEVSSFHFAAIEIPLEKTGYKRVPLETAMIPSMTRVSQGYSLHCPSRPSIALLYRIRFVRGIVPQLEKLSWVSILIVKARSLYCWAVQQLSFLPLSW